MRTREEIITSMCYTFRHDFGLLITDADIVEHGGFCSGMNRNEQIALWNQMAQIFDNDIVPFMEFKNE